MMNLTRRRMLSSLGAGAGAYALSDTFWPASAGAENLTADELPLLIFCEFNGAWDTLLSLDPRDHTDSRFNDPAGSVYTGYEMVAEEDGAIEALMSNNNSGLVTPNGSNISFGPAIGDLASHFEDLCVLRGVNMGTLTHEVGRRYFLTGKFPRGLAASGSAMATFWVNEHTTTTPIPNLVIRSETFNEGLDPKASGLKITGYQDLSKVLRSLNASLDPGAKGAAALAALQSDPSCLDRQLDVGGMTSAYRASFEKALVFSEGTLWQHFNFIRNPPENSAIYDLYQAFGLNPANPNSGNALAGPRGQAAIAAQALTNNIAQAVSVQLASGIDHHDEDWATDHAPALRDGFNALASLISYLKTTLDSNGKPFWDRTTIMAVSDFARTPNINPRGGRDHHLSSACLVAGRGIKGNQVIGGTTDNNYSGRPINMTTGAPDDITGQILRPPDIHRTVLDAAGLPYEHIANQDPVLVKAMLG